MNSMQFRVRTAVGDWMSVQSDGMSVHESGALIFANVDANGNPIPSLVISPIAYQQAQAIGPVPVQQPEPPPVNRAQRRAKAKA
jgi:hypothetical protein